MRPALLILAAGMGSRYGSLKQLDSMGPKGETLLDYSLQDALRAGFGKVVFIIRRSFADAFRKTLEPRLPDGLEIAYAFQDIDDLPPGFAPPRNRQRPWGTAQAVWAARQVVSTPFAVVNADDFYGRDAFLRLVRHLRHPSLSTPTFCLVGYALARTLSPNGPVNRGICRVEHGLLRAVREHSGIAADIDGIIQGKNQRNEKVTLPPDAIVSMNCWGFTPAIFPKIENGFARWLRDHIDQPDAECHLPEIVDDLVQSSRNRCTVLTTDGTWFGVTYPQDKAFVQANLPEKNGTF